MSTSWQVKTAQQPRVAELTALLLLFCTTVTGCLVTVWTTPDPLSLWPGVLLSALCCLALHWRNRYPLPVLGFITALTMAEGAIGYLLTPLLMGPLMMVLYSVSLRSGRVTARRASLLAAVCVVITGLFLAHRNHPVVLTVVNPVAWVLLSALLGSYVGVRRAYVAHRIEQADRAQEEEARHRVVQERMRIARELHDVVAHHLALANAQASTAAHLYRTHPNEAFEMLNTLSATTSEALRELKSTVGLLRQDDSGDGLAPAPGLSQLPDLTAACSAAGLNVNVTVTGQPQSLSVGTDLAAFRIIQEALTNVTKHASTRQADVRLTYLPHTLDLTISNEISSEHPAAGAPAAGRGFGLIGMRERAQSAGGTLTAGPRHGGFQVACTLPLHSTS